MSWGHLSGRDSLKNDADGAIKIFSQHRVQHDNSEKGQEYGAKANRTDTVKIKFQTGETDNKYIRGRINNTPSW